jgi:hypothetical protein
MAKLIHLASPETPLPRAPDRGPSCSKQRQIREGTKSVRKRPAFTRLWVAGGMEKRGGRAVRSNDCQSSLLEATATSLQWQPKAISYLVEDASSRLVLISPLRGPTSGASHKVPLGNPSLVPAGHPEPLDHGPSPMPSKSQAAPRRPISRIGGFLDCHAVAHTKIGLHRRMGEHEALAMGGLGHASGRNATAAIPRPVAYNGSPVLRRVTAQ